ncbi:MAG: Spy/CpxP family protein refolding chaperone [Nitrospinae bacterium]|nr:Spy/CpxP family protein refolding chaperone [Nitrospinota bacterium]
MKKSSIVVAMLMAVSLWSAVAYAQPLPGPSGRGRGGPGRLLPLVLRGVNLTDEQKARVKEIVTAHRPTFREIAGQLRVAHQELADKLFGPDAIQEADLTPQVQRVAQLRQQLMQEGLKVAMEVRGVLTPEQLAQAFQLKDRMRALRTEMRGLFGGGQ